MRRPETPPVPSVEIPVSVERAVRKITRGTRVASGDMPSRILIASLIGALVAGTAWALPDLRPEIYEVSVDTNQTVPPGDVADGCAATTDGRTLVRFGVRSWNDGPDPLDIGATGCPDCTTSPPGTACTNPDFQCSLSGTPRAVFLSSARYELLDLAGNVVALGAKRNYCFLDDCVPADQRTYGDCDTHEGVSPGCYDDYEPELSCQYIDATDVPDITTKAFRLRVTIDPDALLPDANRGNNVTEVVLPGCGDGVLQPGEDCDPGAGSGNACCDAGCHLAAAGTPCRPAAGACDLAEACDGISSICPSDVGMPDGTPCGTGAPPCTRDACRSGACTPVRDFGAGCLIDGYCVAPGMADPADSCQRCEPEESPNAWSANRDPDPAGVRCGVERLREAAGGMSCPTRIAAPIDRRLGHARAVADRLVTAPPGRVSILERRLLRMTARVSRLLDRATRHGCTTDAAASELATLVGQLQAAGAS
jgi:lysyl oxidase/disintegrin